VLLLSAWLTGCTFHHSKQALWTPAQRAPAPDATFISEEDSGLSLLGIISLSEPDHYAVLLERARRRYRCRKMHHAQLDFFTDYWIFVSFPVSRVTLICESAGDRSAPAPTPKADAPTNAKGGEAR
jgi:hypothetical protein